jgi:hypothetical protein
MKKTYSLKVMGLMLFFSLDKDILLLFILGQTLALIASPLSLEFTAMLCEPSLDTLMAMKISSQELGKKVWQHFNDRVMFNDKCSYPNGDKTLEP